MAVVLDHQADEDGFGVQFAGTGGRVRLGVSRRFPTASCLVCGAALLLAACGGNGSRASTTRTGSTSSTAAAVGTAVGRIRDRVLKSNELAGLTSGGVAVSATPQQWLSTPLQQPEAQAAAEKAMLTREGFHAGATENFTTADTSGISVVDEFRSVTAARDALAFYVSRLKAPGSTAGTYVPFRVPGTPGAMSFSLGGVSGGINVAFAQGDYYYLVGTGGGGPPAIAELNAAARRLYHQVRG